MPIDSVIAVEILRKQREEKEALDKLISGEVSAPHEWSGICTNNLEYITEVVNAHGWPRADLFVDQELGKVVEYAAWMCIQHGDANNVDLSRTLAGDAGNEAVINRLRESRAELFTELDKIISLQEGCLALMQRDGAANHHIAFVSDRVARNKGEPQIYGTQGVPNPLAPAMIHQVVNPAEIEKRRDMMGLDSYAQHRALKEAVFRQEESPEMLLPPVIRDNTAISAYKNGETILEGVEVKPNKKILFYDFSPKAGLENLESIINLAGYEVEVFYPDSPAALADKLLQVVNNPEYEVVANFNGGIGEHMEAVNIMQAAINRGEVSLPDRHDMRFLVFSDADKIGRFFSYEGVGQAFLVGPIYNFNRDIFPDNHAALLNILDAKQQRDFTLDLEAVNASAQTYDGAIEGVIHGGGTESIMQDRGGFLRDLRPQDGFADILFLESPDGLDEIDRILNHAQANNMLGSYKAIVLSKFTGESEKVSIQDIESVFNKYAVEVPVFYGYPQGHRYRGGDPERGQEFTPLPLHTLCSLHCRDGVVKMEVRPKDNVLEALAEQVKSRDRSEEFVDVDLANIDKAYQAIESESGIIVSLDNPFMRVGKSRASNIARANPLLLPGSEKQDLQVVLPDLSHAPFEIPAAEYGDVYVVMIRQAVHGAALSGAIDNVKSITFHIADSEISESLSHEVGQTLQDIFPEIAFGIKPESKLSHPLTEKWQQAVIDKAMDAADIPHYKKSTLSSIMKEEDLSALNEERMSTETASSQRSWAKLIRSEENATQSEKGDSGKGRN